MDPCLNKASERQAVGRVHRLGQTKEVHVKTLVMRDSVESRIVRMHRDRAAGSASASASASGVPEENPANSGAGAGAGAGSSAKGSGAWSKAEFDMLFS